MFILLLAQTISQILIFHTYTMFAKYEINTQISKDPSEISVEEKHLCHNKINFFIRQNKYAFKCTRESKN